MSQGVYVLGGKCPGGKCPGGKCPGGICPWGKCPGGTCPGGLCPRTVFNTCHNMNKQDLETGPGYIQVESSNHVKYTLERLDVPM